LLYRYRASFWETNSQQKVVRNTHVVLVFLLVTNVRPQVSDQIPLLYHHVTTAILRSPIVQLENKQT
jgi:hypothetical protein